MQRLFNSLFARFESLKWLIIASYSTVIMKSLGKLQGIEMGSGIRFYGLAKFVVFPATTIRIGEGCVFRSKPTSNLIGINRPCIISGFGNGSKLSIGKNCGFSGTVIGCFKEISIEDNVMCGANTLITDGDWHQNDSRSNPPRPVFIESGAWLGVNVTVLKGVRIGANSVIGAGSVVVHDVPANVIAAGNPCKVVKLIK